MDPLLFWALMNTERNPNHLATIKKGVQTGATCPKVSCKIMKNKNLNVF